MPKTTDKTILANPTKAVAQVFGFDLHYFQNGLKESDKKATKKNGAFVFIEDDPLICKKCGLVQEKGYYDPANRAIGENSNDIPFFGAKHSPFLCVYCHYLGKIWQKKYQKKLLGAEYGSVFNILVTADGVQHINARATEDNEVYDILLNPPQEPYILILGETKGTATATAYYHPLPNAGRNRMLSYTFGHREFTIDTREVFRCIESAERIRSDTRFKGLTISEDIFYNRKKTSEYNDWLSYKLRENKAFMEAYAAHISRFDEGTRLMAKIVLKRWQSEHKPNKKEKNNAKQTV